MITPTLALVALLLRPASAATADVDHFDPAQPPGAAVAVSSAPSDSTALARASAGGIPDAAAIGWSEIETPQDLAVGERPAWTLVVPARKAWTGPKRLERLNIGPQFVDRDEVDGVSRLRHREGPGDATSAAFLAAAPAAAAGAGATKVAAPASKGAAGAGSPRAAQAAWVPRGGFAAVQPTPGTPQVAMAVGQANGQVWGLAIKPGETGRLVGRDETQRLGERNLWEVTEANGVVRYVRASPLVFDLKGGGVRTSARTVLYDLYGTGKKERMEWINDLAPRMGLLVFDAERTGVSGENGLGLFGDSTDLDGDGKADGYLDGFKALRAFVAKAIREKVVDGSVWKTGVLGPGELKALEKAYGLKMRVGGLNAKPQSLAAAGVSAISFTGAKVETVTDFDGLGNDSARQAGAVFLRADGTTGGYDDVWFKPKNDAMVGK